MGGLLARQFHIPSMRFSTSEQPVSKRHVVKSLINSRSGRIPSSSFLMSESSDRVFCDVCPPLPILPLNYCIPPNRESPHDPIIPQIATDTNYYTAFVTGLPKAALYEEFHCGTIATATLRSLRTVLRLGNILSIPQVTIFTSPKHAPLLTVFEAQ